MGVKVYLTIIYLEALSYIRLPDTANTSVVGVCLSQREPNWKVVQFVRLRGSGILYNDWSARSFAAA